MPDKRPLDPGHGDSDSKRVRSNNGSPAPPPAAAVASEIERKKQEAAARMAAVKAKLAAAKAQQNGTHSAAATQPPASSPVPPVSDLDAKRADAQRKIAEMKAKMAAQKAGQTSILPASRSPAPLQDQQKPVSDVHTRIAEARARAAALTAQRNAAPTPPPPRIDGGRSAKGGLGIGLHPSLMGDIAKPVDKKQQGTKFSTTKGNQRPELASVNPYMAASADDAVQQSVSQNEQDGLYDPSIIAKRTAGERKSKGFLFNQKGKFIAQANALRQQAKLEDMKRRIAMETRKAEIEEASDKAFLVAVPPEVEWWDEGLLPPEQNSYDGWEMEGRNKIEGEDSIITVYVQHPVLLQPPQDKFAPAPKPMMLTPKEQKKLRRQRRMADMKEEQAKIRLGLVEPPPPKVKKSNMMRVLGEQAVKDPTAVEARVNREIAQRKADHEQANDDRQLTKEQRREKLARQQEQDEAKGIKLAVFKVDNLSSGKHRFQVDQNARQNALTGIVVLHPTMNVIVVEGGHHSISAYKKLMLQRIKWQENTLPLSNTPPTTFTGRPREDSRNSEPTKEQKAASTWLNPTNQDGELKDLGENKCILVWEGDEKERSFRKWGSRVCETDGEARDMLSKMKMENMWTLARSMKADDF